MTSDVGPACSESKLRHQRDQHSRSEGDAWVYSLPALCTGRLPHTGSTPSSTKSQQQQNTVTLLWWVHFVLFLFFQGYSGSQFLISIFLFRIQFQILKVVGA